MSLSPSRLLQHLKELRLWQRSQDDLLKRNKNDSPTPRNVTALSDYNTIEGLSAFDSTLEEPTPPKVDWESQPISPAKPFEQLLEEKLAQDVEPADVLNKPRRPFLRKGVGLQRFRMNPGDQKKKPGRRKPNKAQNVKSGDIMTPLRAPDLSIKPKAVWCPVIQDKSDISIPNGNNAISAPSEQTLYEKELEKELLIFEALERRADNSSFCSTNSSIVRMLSSTPGKKIELKPPVIAEEPKHVRWNEDHEGTVRPHISELLRRLQKIAEMNANAKQIMDSHTPSSSEENLTSDGCSVSSISSTDLEMTVTETVEKCDAAVGTQDPDQEPKQPTQSCTFCEKQLKQKLDEYNEKIHAMSREKSAIATSKMELQHKKQALEDEFEKRLKEIEDERKLFLYELEADRKKLAKEKSMVQSYIKDSQNRPNKKEREEIGSLKQEVADLKETLKLKDSKNGMTQARLRNQIKQLEKENGRLKDEVEKLQKDNAKLSAAQKLKRKSSDSKILQEINKNITKMAQETAKTNKSVGEISPIQRRRNSRNTEHERESSQEKMGITYRKQPDDDDSLLETTNFRNLSYGDVRKQYENVFGGDLRQNATMNESKKNDRTERLLDDGTKEIKYPNGNIKTVSADGNLTVMHYYNGDIKETSLIDGIIRYFYKDKNIWQTSNPDGTELIEFPEGPKEKRHQDGKCEVTFPDGTTQTIRPDGTQEVTYTDGSCLQIDIGGDKILHLPNGQKEIQTKDHKRREYPDGTVKILYPDGTQETRYSNGRVRIKDPKGILVMDTL